MSDLAALRDLVELDLDDSGNDIWSTDDLDRALKRALVQYSEVNPQQEVGTVVLGGDGREVDISALTGLMRVVKVWYPYTSTDPEDPPSWVRWEMWADDLYIASGDEPANGLTVRVFYHKAQEIKDLDGAAATTVSGQDEEVILLGAGGYAVLQQGRSAVGAAGVSMKTPDQWMKWGLNRMDAFYDALGAVRKRELRKIDKRVPMHVDGWERDGYRDGV